MILICTKINLEVLPSLLCITIIVIIIIIINNFIHEVVDRIIQSLICSAYHVSNLSWLIYHLSFYDVSVEGEDDMYPGLDPFDPLLYPPECCPGPGACIPYAGTPPGKYTVNTIKLKYSYYAYIWGNITVW
jgi:hypothetical protein